MHFPSPLARSAQRLETRRAAPKSSPEHTADQYGDYNVSPSQFVSTTTGVVINVGLIAEARRFSPIKGEAFGEIRLRDGRRFHVVASEWQVAFGGLSIHRTEASYA